MNTQSYYPTRRAILIGCPGGGDTTFLSGVKQDLENVSHYLKSQSGGAWNNAEIRTLYKTSHIDVLKAIRSATADYVFVYFSGHGYTDSSTQRQILCLHDNILPDSKLLNNSPLQLIIIDACRDEVKPYISGIPELLPEYDYFSGSPARELFDNCIRKSPAGIVIVYSAVKGEPSHDTPTGGMFTNALLQTSGGIITQRKYTPVPIRNLLTSVQQLLNKQFNYQTPSVTNISGNLTVPFAIGIPQSEIPIPLISHRNSNLHNQTYSNNGWLALGLGVLILMVASSKTKR